MDTKRCYYCQGIIQLEINQITLQPPWACEIPRDTGVRISKEGGETDL